MPLVRVWISGFFFFFFGPRGEGLILYSNTTRGRRGLHASVSPIEILEFSNCRVSIKILNSWCCFHELRGIESVRCVYKLGYRSRYPVSDIVIDFIYV